MIPLIGILAIFILWFTIPSLLILFTALGLLAAYLESRKQ